MPKSACNALPTSFLCAVRLRRPCFSAIWLRLAVADDGPGLSEAARARLLSEAPVEPGGGVGLRLVRDLVAVLGGRLDCERAQGRTRITVRLPVGDQPRC